MAVNDHTKSVEGEYVGIYASMGEATNDVRDRLLNVTNQLNNIAVGNTSKLEELKRIGKTERAGSSSAGHYWGDGKYSVSLLKIQECSQGRQ